MINANNLIKQQQERETRKILTFEKIYTRVEKTINSASLGNFFYTWYEIPEFIVGLPLYSLSECIKYIQNKLLENEFNSELIGSNVLIITWFPNK